MRYRLPGLTPPPPVWAGLAVFAVHALLAWAVPLQGSFRKYALAAEHYLAGELPAERLMDFSPLYFHLSVLVERLFPHPEAVVEWLQIVSAGASAGLLFALLERRFGRALAVAGVAVFAVDRQVLVYQRILEPELFLLFFLLAFLVLVDRMAGAPEGRGWRVGVAAGGVAALAVATRPTFLPMVVLAPLYLWLRDLRGRPLLRRTAALAVPVAAVAGVLALRALVATGDPRTPVMNPGTVFFEGNNPLSEGTSAIYPPVVLELVRHSGALPDAAHAYYRDVARADAGDQLSIAEVNAFWAERAGTFLRAEPVRFLKLLRTKLVRACHGFRWHDVPTAWKYDRRLPVPTVSFALVAALALLGALLEVRRWRRSLLFYALGAVQLGVMLAFYVSARQRLVLVPVAIYFAAAAVAAVRRERRRGWLLLPAALLALLLLLPDPAIRDELYQRRGYLETDRLLQEIRERSREAPLADHAGLAVAAVAASPWWLEWLRPAYFPRQLGTLEERVAAALEAAPPGPYPFSAAFDRATLYLEAGRLADAEDLLRELAATGETVYRGARQPSDPRILLGRAQALQGRRGEAVETLRAALADRPGDPFALTELLAVTGDPAFRAPLEATWSSLDLRFLLGRAHLRHGRAAAAVDDFRFVASRLPDFREARVYLAAALAEAGRTEAAVREYLAASRIRLEPVVAPGPIAELFRRWVARHPESGEVRFYAAQVLHQLGYFREALELLDGLDPPPPMAGAVARERRRIEEAVAAASETVRDPSS